MITYRPLETEFLKNGFRFRLLRRDGDVAIFHKVALKGGHHPVSFDAGFETVRVGRHDGYEIAGVQVEPAETLPGNEQWGMKGWSFPTLFAAELKFEELLGKTPVQTCDDVEGEDCSETSETPTTEPRVAGHRGRAKGERPQLIMPDSEFTVKELADANKVDYPVAFLFIKESVVAKTIQFLRTERRNAKGKESSIYVKI
jgi:hypothetical protein